MAEAIKFVCSVYKVSTTVDNGIRVTLDMAENNAMQMAMLAECKRMGVVLDITALPVVQNENNAETPSGKKGRPQRASLRSG